MSTTSAGKDTHSTQKNKSNGHFFLDSNIVHFRQRYSWDCGLSCILMILGKEAREHMLQSFENVCKEEGFGQSTWTIDLCFVLKRYRVKHVFYTLTLGVKEEYKDENYYRKIIEKDKERVRAKFDSAAAQGIECVQSSLELADLLDHLRLHGPVLLLVDASQLLCDLCKFNKLNLELRSCMPWSRQYLGHYIVLCGYNLRKNKILYRNPGLRDRVCAISCADLEAAHRSRGTDEDAILIYSR